MSPQRLSRNSPVSISSIRSIRSFPLSGEPDRPIFFKIEISPPSSLISRPMGKNFPSLRPDVEPLSAGARRGIPAQPLPQLREPYADLRLNRHELFGTESRSVRPLLRKQVVLNLWFGPGTAHRNPGPIFQFENQHFFFRNFVALDVAKAFRLEIPDVCDFNAEHFRRRLRYIRPEEALDGLRALRAFESE